ncbi:MAG: 2-succinyl-5-enolpyruvyl-6-hydroxy-3-cyclohexene-1-carboxylic-acid synthase [Verrucomicrobiales bacterium]|nr:2-succinyl-5-enolpyruvyl-6-hydroxy-3-cyclohexene-1-carboxylic-acid synthase [Verrucomicrobiales bacterium]
MTSNAELAGATLGHLAGLGVSQFVVCAGARNTPLVSSLLAVSEKKELRIWHHFDERSASFFALGLSKAKGEPVAVLTTSGTAVAELLPATIEAYYSGVPLILVTADRPASFRGSGAPQAIEQKGIFGHYAPVSIDVQEATDLSWVLKWPRNEPLHLNVCLEEPKAEDRVEDWSEIALPTGDAVHAHADDLSIEAFVANCHSLVVVLGEIPGDWQETVENFLADLAVPVWAEATSGLRESERLAPWLLRAEKEVASLSPREILRIGGVPSLRFWRDLEIHREIEVLSVTRRPFSGLARPSRHLVVEEFPDLSEWEVGFSQGNKSPKESGSAAALLETLLASHPNSEPALMRQLSERIPEEALVFLGNSLPIREWNLAASPSLSHPHCFANRGANGIDGEVATFLGMAEGGPESWGIFGDLTALYDLNAPALLEQLSEGRRRIVVMNNGGGRIFSRLPSMAGLKASEKKFTENRHHHCFASWAEMWGLDYLCWKAGEEPPKIAGDHVLIEILPDEEATEAFWADWQ